MFGNGSFRPMNGIPVRMGQAPVASWWPAEALSSVQKWDGLVARASQIPDDLGRQEILDWIGRSDIPGSPSERYAVVVTDVTGGFTPSTEAEASTLRARLDALNRYVSELEARVMNAEQAYGLFPASAEAENKPERSMMIECVSGGVALLAFVILPLVFD